MPQLDLSNTQAIQVAGQNVTVVRVGGVDIWTAPLYPSFSDQTPSSWPPNYISGQETASVLLSITVHAATQWVWQTQWVSSYIWALSASDLVDEAWVTRQTNGTQFTAPSYEVGVWGNTQCIRVLATSAAGTIAGPIWAIDRWLP